MKRVHLVALALDANFHPTVLQVDRSLQTARIAGSGTFVDFANN